MVVKLNVYTLTNFFSKKSTLFIPKSDSEVHEKIIDKLSKQKISIGELKTLEDIYNGIGIIPNLDKNIKVHSYYDQFLFHPNDIPFQINKIPEVFTPFRKKIEKSRYEK